jgi:hypothetical protein
LIGSIRRECVDHVVALGEWHLRHVLLSYLEYYNEARTHISLNTDAPMRAPCRLPGAFCAGQFWADCITNMAGPDFRQAHVSRNPLRSP